MSAVLPKVDVALSMAAQEFKNAAGQFVGDVVCPEVALPMSFDEITGYQGAYFKYDRRDTFGDADATDPDKYVRAPGADIQEVTDRDRTLTTFSLQSWDQVAYVPGESTRYLGVDQVGHIIQMLTQNRMIAREREAAALVFATGNYATGLSETLAGGSTLVDSGVDPADEWQRWMRLVQAEIGVKPTVGVLGSLTARKARGMFAGNLRGGGALDTGLVSLDRIAQLVGFDGKLYEGGAVYNNANSGQAFSTADVWGDDDLALLYVPPSPSMGVEGFAYRFHPADKPSFEVTSWYEPKKKSWAYALHDYSIIHQVSDLCGYLTLNAV